MVLPLNILIPNTGPPTLRNKPLDVKVKINEVESLKFSLMPDPDFDDTGSLSTIELGAADSFITGQFPNYKINPRNNDTDPGIYNIKLVLTDDNPAPQTSTYNFKIIVEALPPPVINVLALNGTN
jgi:hypothetical protein